MYLISHPWLCSATLTVRPSQHGGYLRNLIQNHLVRLWDRTVNDASDLQLTLLTPDYERSLEPEPSGSATTPSLAIIHVASRYCVLENLIPDRANKSQRGRRLCANIPLLEVLDSLQCVAQSSIVGLWQAPVVPSRLGSGPDRVNLNLRHTWQLSVVLQSPSPRNNAPAGVNVRMPRGAYIVGCRPGFTLHSHQNWFSRAWPHHNCGRWT